MPIKITTAKSIEEFNAVVWLQAEIWGDPTDVVPTHMLLTFANEGGSVLLAYDGDQPIGFAFGFLSTTETGRLKLASHQAGVLPDYQSRGVGYQLKLAQKEEALKKGLDLITWTFDPLQALNARFNLHKLGAVCNTYIENLYGEMTDALNQGLPSDRFKVHWWLSTEHVTRRLLGTALEPELQLEIQPILNPATAHTIPPDTVELPGDSATCLVEIPPNLAQLKRQNPAAALKWRLQTREIFTHAFNQGYTATDVLRHKGGVFYLLQKNWLSQ